VKTFLLSKLQSQISWRWMITVPKQIFYMLPSHKFCSFNASYFIISNNELILTSSGLQCCIQNFKMRSNLQWFISFHTICIHSFLRKSHQDYSFLYIFRSLIHIFKGNRRAIKLQILQDNNP
jgi:hypothetical protein